MTTPTIPADPIVRFQALLAEAIALPRERLPEPTAFALGTSDTDGRPSVRMLLLKSVTHDGFVFYTNTGSRKGRDLAASGQGAMCFHWQPLEVQVRVEGAVKPVSPEEADSYFGSRPRGSQIGAWASLQSQPIEPPGELDRRVAEFEKKFASGVVPRPAHWSGFRLVPSVIEFWKNMPNRLHLRHRYIADGTRWKVSTLYP
jgi:pyridoxamine 5'-phosphate oxidase